MYSYNEVRSLCLLQLFVKAASWADFGHSFGKNINDCQGFHWPELSFFICEIWRATREVQLKSLHVDTSHATMEGHPNLTVRT